MREGKEMPEKPHCHICGYTKEDAVFHLDHHLCRGEIPASQQQEGKESAESRLYSDLTLEEIKAIRALKRVAKIWPESLWLFSAAAELEVMKKNEYGEKVFVGDNVDQEYVVDRIDIENDGGDW